MTPLERYVAPAKARPGFWRFLLGSILIAGFWFLGVIVVMSAWFVMSAFGPNGFDSNGGQMEALMAGGDPVAILFMLASFGGAWIGVLFVGMVVHGQSFGSFFGPSGDRAVQGFLKGVALTLLIALPTLISAVLDPESLLPGLAPERWIVLILPLIAMVMVQATAEELIFRGYLLQQLAVRSHSAVIWAGVPSVLFGLMHVGNAEPGPDAIFYMLLTFVLGLTLSVLVWRSGSLWPAIGMHVSINVIGFAVIHPEGQLTGTQLFMTPKNEMGNMLMLDLVAVLIILALVISPLGRVFGDGRRVTANGDGRHIR